MTKDKQNYFSRKITEANRTELLVIVYDIIAEELNCAMTTDAADEFHHSLQQVQRYLSNLMATLDFRYEPSKHLFSLYEYIQRLVVRSDISKSPESLEEALGIIKRLRNSFNEISVKDTSAPVMANTQTLYAGLTYSKASLNETSLDPGFSKRGFLA